MKLNLRISILLFSFLTLCSHSLPAQQKKRKQINASVNINSSINDTLKVSHLNLGFLTNIYQLNGFGLNIVSSVIRNDVNGLQVSGLANISGKNMNGAQLAGICNIVGDNSNGLQTSGLVNLTGNKAKGLILTGGTNITGQESSGLIVGGLINVSGENAKGLHLSGLANISAQDNVGLAISGLMNVNAKDLKGGQLSALLNISGNEAKGAQVSAVGNVSVDVKGVQLSSISNIVASNLTGLQLCGAVNVAMKMDKAVQLAPLTNICMQQMGGAQIGLANYATEIKGTQVGLINICGGNVKGVQIGLINHSKDTSAVKIGLVNVTPRTRIQLMLYGGNMAKFNVAARFQNRISYSMLGVGTHYLDLNDKFSGALFYRTGLYHSIFTKKLLISGDIGYYHIENFENESASVPERMYSLQGRVNLEYHPLKKLGVFASGGYSVTRYYNKNKMFEKKPIVEVGIVLF